MINKRRIIRSAAVLLAALATGHFMQSNAFAAKLVTPEFSKNTVSSGPVAPLLVAALPTPPRDVILPAGLSQPDLSNAVRVASTSIAINPDVQTDAPTPSLYELSCNIKLKATPFIDGMVRLKLDAPCYRNQRVLISHAGVEFADITGSEGTYSVVIPAFSESNDFRASFTDGNSADTKTRNMKVHEFNRVAVSWGGGPAIHIHALEFGANYGEPGHVWAESTDVTAEGGMLIQLGNPDIRDPMLAEIYSFPNEVVQQEGSIRVIIEAEFTPMTCGTSLAGKTVTVSPNEPVQVTAVSVTMPECNGPDGFLVLKNLLQDMKIALN